jgi:hypothetical protein
MMTKKEDAIAKMDQKQCQRKDTTAAMFIELKKQAIEIQKIEAKAMLLRVKNQIMLADRVRNKRLV